MTGVHDIIRFQSLLLNNCNLTSYISLLLNIRSVEINVIKIIVMIIQMKLPTLSNVFLYNRVLVQMGTGMHHLVLVANFNI